ncbi:MAG: hypothetical protein AVDCRST_MAG19-4736 [uncultured Thermomicrobiales bacterium]|uniref:Uncharacterized protein n=1 Tax=uncultured Thermomicrobiales bacterium TaxID=1645740 RepID=A0A6J4VP27_9BACT|nr:MAG: hypothetical protein AVDCRST_MAG19-4736 [uncultured Thermomicrobiales bacterium]
MQPWFGSTVVVDQCRKSEGTGKPRAKGDAGNARLAPKTKEIQGNVVCVGGHHSL